jgi:hypothetical protein
MFAKIIHFHLPKTAGTSINRWLDLLTAADRARPADYDKTFFERFERRSGREPALVATEAEAGLHRELVTRLTADVPALLVAAASPGAVGGVGAGHAMKCINNCITAMTLANTAEGLVAGKRYGLDPKVMVDVLNISTGGSWITQTHFHQRVFNRAFDDPFKLELMLKDVGIAVQLARETATPVPIWGVGQQLWRMADHAAGSGASVSHTYTAAGNYTATVTVTARVPASPPGRSPGPSSST